MTSELIFLIFLVLKFKTVISKIGGKTRAVRKPFLQLVDESAVGALFSCSTIPKPRHKNGTIDKSECNNRKKIFPRGLMLNVKDLKQWIKLDFLTNRTTGDAYLKLDSPGHRFW